MPLDLDEVADYLLERRLVKPQAVVDGEFRVENVSRLNRVYLVSVKPGRSYVLKHGRDPREAAVLERLGPAPWLPRVVGFDAELQLLILEAAPGAQPFERCQRPGQYSHTLARETGRALAALHRLPPDLTADLGITTGRAQALLVHDLDLARLQTLSAASIAAVRFIQNFDGLGSELEALVADATNEATVHGDVRWQNCLGVPSGTRRTRVQLIDWEFTTAGDPAADVGEFFGAYLLAWQITISRVTAEALVRSRAELARLQLAIRAFWAAYATDSDLPTEALGRLLRRAVRYAGARMVVAALEETQAGEAFTLGLEDTVRFGAEVLRRPDQAGAQLLGLRPTWS